MAVFNESDFIEASLKSILEYEGNHHLEIVVVDDRSTDDTAEKVKKLSEAHPQLIKFYANDTKGKVAAMNLAYLQSNADFFMFLGGDDLFEPSAVDERVKPLLGLLEPAISLAALVSFSHTHTFRPHRKPMFGGGNPSAGAVCFNRELAQHYFPIPSVLPNEDNWLGAVSQLFSARTFDVDVVAFHHRTHSGNSWNRGGNFAEVSASIALRRCVYDMALTQFSSGTKPAARKKVTAMASLEEHRKAGRWISVLLTRDVPLRKRLTVLQFSTPWLFELATRVKNLRARVARDQRGRFRAASPARDVVQLE